MPCIRYEQPAWLQRWSNKCDASWDLDLLPDKQRERMNMIFTAEEILNEYDEKGFQLTLRQLYYQFVARDLLANKDANYKKLGAAVSDGRMWGFLDWNQLVDRGRNFESRTHWEEPETIIQATASSFSVDRWRDSDYRIEVWVEKQALEDIIAQACRPFDIGYLACKGYMSQSEMWAAARRLIKHEDRGQRTIILHLGDHDPSGMDMTRDIQERMHTFRSRVEVKRIALNMDQIERYNPPPNPAKLSDSRAQDYIAKYGDESWELDALSPEVLTALIQDEINEAVDSCYYDRTDDEDQGQWLLKKCSKHWSKVTELLEKTDEM